MNQKNLPKELTKIIDFKTTLTPGLEKEAGTIVKLWKEIILDRKNIKKHWREIQTARHTFMRDYNNALSLKILSSVSWRVWGDKKRHRTVPMTVDSIYYSLERCRPIFNKYAVKIQNQKLSKTEINLIDRYFTVPPSIRNNHDLLYNYLNQIKKSLDVYFVLVEKHKIKPSDAIFVMPRGVRIDLLQNYDLFNLISGYFPLRTCSTAEIQLRIMTRIEMSKIKQLLRNKGLNNLEKLILTKCHIPGFCLEEKNCPIINSVVKNYDENFHEEMKTQLDEEFEEKLKSLGK